MPDQERCTYCGLPIDPEKFVGGVCPQCGFGKVHRDLACTVKVIDAMKTLVDYLNEKELRTVTLNCFGVATFQPGDHALGPIAQDLMKLHMKRGQGA